jgi:hypothetical protein
MEQNTFVDEETVRMEMSEEYSDDEDCITNAGIDNEQLVRFRTSHGTQQQFDLLFKPQRVERVPDKYTVPELLELTGGFGRMQWFSFVTVLMWNLAVSFYAYNLPYLELKPQLLWKTTGDFGVCSADKVCTSEQFMQWQIDYNDETTVHNWMTEDKAFCISGFKLGLIGSYMFCGILISTILIQLADYIGRKYFIQIASIISIIVVNLLFFVKSIDSRMVLCLIIGCLNSIYYASYTYLLEISPKSGKTLMNYLFCISECFIPTFGCACYFYFGGNDWQYLFYFTLMIAPLGFILSIFLPKSPQFLVECGEIGHAIEELEIIAAFNNSELPEDFILVPENQEDNNSISEKKWEYFNNYKNFYKLMIVIILLSYWCFNGVLIDYHIKYVNVSMFLINIIRAIVGTVSILFSSILLHYLDFK